MDHRAETRYSFRTEVLELYEITQNKIKKDNIKEEML